MVVLGNSNVAEREADVERCHSENVPVLKRYGGGGAVVLYPGCVILSLGCWVRSAFDNEKYFRLINEAVLDLLRSAYSGLDGLSQKGISDLCAGERKFAGTSLFRTKNYLLYQASLICDLDVDTIAKYLRHPSKEPDYRAKRSHKDFLVGLKDVDSRMSVKSVEALCVEDAVSIFNEALTGELIAPVPEQFKNIEARVQRASSSSAP
jgi:lipoate-protein ligase A